MVKHTQTIRCQIAEELFGLSVFEHFVGLAFKGLTLNPRLLYYKKTPKISSNYFQMSQTILWKLLALMEIFLQK